MRFMLVFILGLIILLASCTTTTNYYQATVESWRGAKVKELIHHWGEPEKKMRLRDGHIVYFYHLRCYHVSPKVDLSFTPGTLPPPGALANIKPCVRRDHFVGCVTGFEVSEGLIVGTQIQSKACNTCVAYARKMMNPRTVIVKSPSRICPPRLCCRWGLT